MISRFSLTTARICTTAFSNFAIILFVASLISLAIFVFRPNTIVKAQEPQKSCPICSPDAVQTDYAPTIGLPEATKSEIVLNCRSNHVMNVTPTFYTSDGEAVVGNEIQMQPSEMRFVTIESLIPDEHRNRHEWGGMTLTYSGKTLEMWAQITLHGVDGIGSADVTFSQLLGRGTNTQEAVWYVPNGNSRTIIALGNSSGEIIQTQLEYSNGQIEEISIEPFATRYIRRNDNVNSVRLTTTGPAGALKATGIVANKNQKFVSGIRFYEPKAAVQPNLFASNLVIKDRSPHMLLKNTTSQSINAQAIFRPTNGEGEPVIYEPVTINAGETKEIDLQQLKAALKNRNDLESVSVQIKNDGQPGSLIGALYSTDQASKITQDIPLRDSGIKRTSTGAYPFRLDDDYSSTVYINNVGSQAADFNVRIWYEGGVYKLPMQKVEPGQTASYNIRKLRDEQVPDKDGNILPANVTVGQFAWSMIHITDEMKLVGRSEVISRSKKVDSSYSCPICCPNWGPVFGPLPVYVASGQNFGYYLDGFWYDCYNRDAGATSESLYAVVSDPTVASADMTTGFFSSNGYDPGQTSWSADYWLWFYQDDGMDCYNLSGPMNTGGPIDVTPTVASLSGSIPSTKNPVTNVRPAAGTFNTTNVATDFASGSNPADALVTFQGSEANLTITANGVVPTTSASSLKWKIDRDPNDSGLSGTPTLSTLMGAQTVITPNRSGNFRLICWYDANEDGSYNAGEELKVLRLVIVETTIVTSTCHFVASPAGAFDTENTSNHVKVINAMRLTCAVLLKSGGANRLVALDNVHLGVVGNLTTDNFTVQYPIPNPAPSPPGNQAGTQFEAPNGKGITNPNDYFPLPMVDTRRGSENDGGPSGGESAFRVSSTTSNSLQSGGGRLVTVEALDVPTWSWDQFNQHTGNGWETTSGTVAWREYVVGYADAFPKTYVGIAQGDWRVVLIGTSDFYEWTPGSGASAGVVNAMSSLITGNAPKNGDLTGVQVVGLSFAWRNEMKTTP